MNRFLSLCLVSAILTGTYLSTPVSAAEQHSGKAPLHKVKKPPKASPKPVAAKTLPQTEPTLRDEEGTPPDMMDVPDETSSATTIAADTHVAMGGKPFPWFGSLKKTEVNVRSGPGNKYPVLWIYQRPGYPVQVLTRYDNYYKIKDVEGEEGWVYIGMVSKRVTALVGGEKPIHLYKKADPASTVVARLAPDVVVEVNTCEAAETRTFCKVIVADTKGWVDKAALDMIE